MDRYRLTPVRDARARDERSARHELAGATGEARAGEARVTAAAQRVGEARAALEAARAAFHALADAGSRPGLLALAEHHAARRRRDLDDAIGARLRAEAELAGWHEAVDGARASLARARTDRELIERHFARWREARHKLAERRED